MIRLEATTSQFLLYVPFTENARAKAIDGRRWDPLPKAWAYPKTKRAYDAIIAEFGAELGTHSVEPPSDTAIRTKSLPGEREVVADALRRENDALRSDIQSLRESVDQVVASTKQGASITELQRTLLAREAEIGGVREQLASARSRIQELELSGLKLQQDVKESREARLRRPVQRISPAPVANPTNGLAILQQFVRSCVPTSSSLHSRLDKLAGGEYTAVEIGKLVENELRARLGAYEGQSFHDLINHASDTELLSTEGRDFAHIIRKQRNNVVHDNVTKRSFELRGALSLASAGLLWSDFD